MIIDDIMNEIYNKSGRYMEALNNIVPKDYRDEVLSEIISNWMENIDRTINLYEKGELFPYFLSAIRFQYKSTTSSFYKNRLFRKPKHFKVEYTSRVDIEYLEEISPDLSEDIKDKIELENQIKLIETSLAKLKIEWWEERLFREYYFEGLSYRKISDKYDYKIINDKGKEVGMSNVSIRNTVIKVLELLKKEIF